MDPMGYDAPFAFQPLPSCVSWPRAMAALLRDASSPWWLLQSAPRTGAGEVPEQRWQRWLRLRQSSGPSMDLMRFNGDLMGFNSDLMGFNGDLMGFNGDLMVI